jgi:hypothetical protein
MSGKHMSGKHSSAALRGRFAASAASTLTHTHFITNFEVAKVWPPFTLQRIFAKDQQAWAQRRPSNPQLDGIPDESGASAETVQGFAERHFLSSTSPLWIPVAAFESVRIT